MAEQSDQSPAPRREDVKALEVQANRALAEADRRELTAVREEVRGILAAPSLDEDGLHEATALAENLTTALESRDSLVAECTMADPFAEAWFSIEDGVTWMRCAHDPPHRIRANQ